ncbi:MAG: LysM domain-containing protein [Deferrisomatales bacterium]|nr:LysM domain-containing protein [Deferrisomatales bacterium]
MARRKRGGACLAVFAVLGILSLARAQVPGEPPPAQGTRLRFERALSVQSTEVGTVFVETHTVAPGEDLWEILSRGHGATEEDLPGLLEAFRAVNPSADPRRLVPGQVIRVPVRVDGGPRPPPPESPASTYTVEAGDSLWRILRTRLQVPQERMQDALQAVARANPQIRNLDRIYVGQKIVLPTLAEAPPGRLPPRAVLPASYRTSLQLLQDLGCEVVSAGETFLPLGGGQTLRLDASDFPLVVGPSGSKVILDPRGRLSAALARAAREEWGYHCVAGVDADPEAYLGAILPHLGFFELTEGERSISLGGGTELVALARWTVVPTPEDLWAGNAHLLFPPGSALDPRLVQAALRAGFASHPLGPVLTATPTPAWAGTGLAVLPMSDPAEGAARLLSLLGVSHRVRPVVEWRLEGGVTYRISPLLTLRFGGLEYAVPPAAPARAEQVLTRAGYFTIPWPSGATPLNVLGDLLALLGTPHDRATVDVPPGQALRLRVSGILLEESRLAAVLYPDLPGGRLLLTEGNPPAAAAEILLEQGFLPWLVR